VSYDLPTRVVAPWEVAVGAAYRLGPGACDGYAGARFRDEAAVILAADVLVLGRLSRATGIEAFADGQMQGSGRSATISPRLGLEWEGLPGRLRLRSGTYHEPARFAGVPGRLHATAGGEVRLFAFHLWGLARRLALQLAADSASNYGNVSVSIGFWQ
jgi:hypothetical protein